MSSQSHDFSLFSLFTAGLAFFAPLTAAYTQPVGDSPSGNPISQPGLNSVVPVGEPFSVTWEPTTPGTVTLVLLKGPASNAVPQYAIAEQIPNNGTYVWTPSTDLAPGDTGYGIQLIVDSTGQYQYTTQFGIENDNYSGSSGSASAPWGSWPTSAGAWTSNAWTSTVSGFPTGTAYSGRPHNVTIVSPTGAMTVPTSLQTTLVAPTTAPATTTPVQPTAAPTRTNAANPLVGNVAGVVLAAGVAVLAL